MPFCNTLFGSVELNPLFFIKQFLDSKTVARNAIIKTFNILELGSFSIIPVVLPLWTFHFPSISFLYKRGNLRQKLLRGCSLGRVNIPIWLKTLTFFFCKAYEINLGNVITIQTFPVSSLYSSWWAWIFFFFLAGWNLRRNKHKEKKVKV